MSATSLSFSQARAVVLYFCGDFHENLPADVTPEQFAVDVEQLARKLSHYVEAEVKVYDVEGVVNRLIEFTELDSGDHEDLVPTANGVIDEGGAIRDRLSSQLDDDLYFTVTGAGIDPVLTLQAAA